MRPSSPWRHMISRSRFTVNIGAQIGCKSRRALLLSKNKIIKKIRKMEIFVKNLKCIGTKIHQYTGGPDRDRRRKCWGFGQFLEKENCSIFCEFFPFFSIFFSLSSPNPWNKFFKFFSASEGAVVPVILPLKYIPDYRINHEYFSKFRPIRFGLIKYKIILKG